MAADGFLQKIILQSADINPNPDASAVEPPKEFEVLGVFSFTQYSLRAITKAKLHVNTTYKNTRTGGLFVVADGGGSSHLLSAVAGIGESQSTYKHVVTGDVFELQESK